MHFVYAFGLYPAAGLCVGAAFVTTGADRVLPHFTFSPMARLFVLPGAMALWPYVLIRWLRA